METSAIMLRNSTSKVICLQIDVLELHNIIY